MYQSAFEFIWHLDIEIWSLVPDFHHACGVWPPSFTVLVSQRWSWQGALLAFCCARNYRGQLETDRDVISISGENGTMERTSGSLIESSSGLIFQFGAQIKLTDAWPRMARRPLQQHIKETYGKIMSVKTQRGSGPTQLLTADDSQFLAGSASEDQERGFAIF